MGRKRAPTTRGAGARRTATCPACYRCRVRPQIRAPVRTPCCGRQFRYGLLTKGMAIVQAQFPGAEPHPMGREPFPLQGSTVLVTGASRRAGIGFAIARIMASWGASIVLHHYRPHDQQQDWGADDLDAVVAAVRRQALPRLVWSSWAPTRTRRPPAPASSLHGIRTVIESRLDESSRGRNARPDGEARRFVGSSGEDLIEGRGCDEALKPGVDSVGGGCADCADGCIG